MAEPEKEKKGKGKRGKKVIPEKEIVSSAKSWQNLTFEIVAEGEDYEAEMNKPSEKSEDTWGLKSVDGSYESKMAVDTFEDEFGNIKTKVYKW